MGGGARPAAATVTAAARRGWASSRRFLRRLCGAAAVALLGATTLPAAAAGEPKRTDLIIDLPSAGDLAAPATGQTLFVIDGADGSVTGIDPFEPAKRWTALAAPASDTRRSVAVACIDTTNLAVLCEDRAGWSLRVHGVRPGVAADPEKPVQSVSLGAAAPAGGPAESPSAPVVPCLAVSPSRDWLAVCSLPPPAFPLLRATIQGARVGTASDRGCPPIPADSRPCAATITPADELILFTTKREARPDADVFVTFHRLPDPRRLLHLDTGLAAIRDAALCRGDGTLWVVGGTPGSATVPEGLWRLDAAFRERRQAVQPVLIARLDAPRAVCCLSERAIVVTHGATRRIVSLFEWSRNDAPPSERSDQP